MGMLWLAFFCGGRYFAGMKRVFVHLATLEGGPVRLEGTLPGSVLDLGEDPSVGEVGEVWYELRAERKSSDVLVQGAVWAEMELECGRSGRFFSTEVKESAFLRDYSISENISGVIELTEEIREALLLAVPTYPVSPEAQTESFIPPGVKTDEADRAEDSEESPWSALNNLDLS